jgi:SAM-dependent methyltransferase
MPVTLRTPSPERQAERALLHAGGRASAWHNFGLWPAADYASACEALGVMVGTAAGLQAHWRVLSVGVGDGAELDLWRSRWGCSDVHSTDAAGPVGGESPQSGGPDGLFDAILCVDAAYHFSPRQAWLEACRARLKPGGRLVYTDLSLAPRWPTPLVQGLLVPVLAPAAVRSHQLLHPDRQIERLHRAGFDQAHWQDLSASVLDGFVAFAERQQRWLAQEGLAAPQTAPTAWRRVAVTAQGLRWLRRWRALGLGYGLLSAQVRDHSAPTDSAACNADHTADSSNGMPGAA